MPIFGLAWAQQEAEASKVLFASELGTAKKLLDMLIEFCVKYSFQVLGGILVLALGWFVAKLVAKFLGRFLEQQKVDVTVVVEPKELDQEGNPAYRELNDEEKNEWRQQILAAIGGDETRGDNVVLASSLFVDTASLAPPPAAVPPGATSRMVMAVVQRHVLPIGAMLAALLVVRRMLSRYRVAGEVGPVVPEPELPEEQVSAEARIRQRVQEEVERLSREQPRVLASLLKTWLTSPD